MYIQLAPSAPEKWLRCLVGKIDFLKLSQTPETSQGLKVSSLCRARGRLWKVVILKISLHLNCNCSQVASTCFTDVIVRQWRGLWRAKFKFHAGVACGQDTVTLDFRRQHLISVGAIDSASNKFCFDVIDNIFQFKLRHWFSQTKLTGFRRFQAILKNYFHILPRKRLTWIQCVHRHGVSIWFCSCQHYPAQMTSALYFAQSWLRQQLLLA